jgi:hypothetical protein
MHFKKALLAAVGGASLLAMLAAPALAGYYDTLPTLTSPPGTATVPMDTNYGQGRQPQTGKATLDTIGSAVGASYASSGYRNGLIGGDFGTNLWQRGTTGASTTTALLYGPDRWWGLSGTDTAFTQVKQTSSQTAGFAGSNRVQRTAGQTGVLPICVGQALTSADSTRFQGKLVELSFHAKVGATFSAASSQVTAYIQYGTGASQSAADQSTSSWTGQTNAAATAVTLTTAWDRYSVTGSVPSTATQVGVKICYTPVGTAGATDYFEFTGAQLAANAGAVARTSDSQIAGQYNMLAYEHRPQTIESALQYGYFWRLAEPASGAAISGACMATGANTNICNVNLPVVMRSIPTIAITTAGTFKVNIAGTPTTIATPTASTCSTNSCAVTAANTNTAGQAQLFSGGGGSGAWDVSAEL